MTKYNDNSISSLNPEAVKNQAIMQISLLDNQPMFELMPVFKEKTTDRDYIMSYVKAGTGMLEERTSEFQAYPSKTNYIGPVVTTRMKTFFAEQVISEERTDNTSGLEDRIKEATQELLNSFYNYVNRYQALTVLQNTDTNGINGSGHALGALYSASHSVEDQEVFDWGTTWANLSTSGSLTKANLDVLHGLTNNVLNPKGVKTIHRGKYLVVPRALELTARELLRADNYPVASYAAMPSQKNTIKEGSGQSPNNNLNIVADYSYQVVVSSFMTDANDYYIFADPNVPSCCVYEWYWLKLHNAVAGKHYAIEIERDPATRALLLKLRTRFVPHRGNKRGAYKMSV